MECASNVVLVKQGQSGQDYRLCVNFTDLNARLLVKRYPMRDCNTIISRLSRSKVFSGIDMKSGFLNIRVSLRTLALLGVITQDGLYRYTRMAFGLVEAPMFF